MEQCSILCRTLVRYVMEHHGTFIQAKIREIEKRKTAHADGTRDAYSNKLERHLGVIQNRKQIVNDLFTHITRL